MGKSVVTAPIALGMLLSLILCWSLQAGWGATFGPFLNWLGNLGLDINIKTLPDIHIHPFRFAHTIDVNVRKWLSQGIALSERGFVRFLTMTVEPFVLIVGVVVAFVLALYELGRYLVHVVPHATTTVIRETVVKPVGKAIRYTDAKLTARVNTLTQQLGALRAQVARITHATVGAIASPFPRIGRLERTVKADAKRLTRLEKLLAAGVGTALLVRTLARLGLGWLRCSNVKKAGKSICGMNPSVLEALLLDAAVLTVAFDLEQFAKEMQTVTQEAADLIHRWAT